MDTKSLNTTKKMKYKPVIIGCFWCVCIALIVVLLLHSNPLADYETERLKKICGVLLCSITAIFFTVFYNYLVALPAELYHSRKLIWKLAKNDFKKRYAGSYLGVIWATAQPIVTVLMYWIVFDKIFSTRSELVAAGVEVPYVLYLTAGLVPWFFFSEALSNGMNALLEYNYLVKKVVFNISVLPIIKVIAATFTHLFFVALLLVLSMVYGFMPTLHTIQLLYYSFCLFLLVLAISYFTCSIVVFFRDLQQIISIVLQIGIWATPIMWNIDMIQNDFLKMLFKINPLVYIVNGYRSAIYGERWFWEHFYSSTYFWIIILVLFCSGAMIFRKLKVHFADVM